jgi:hypothetical protein
MRAFFVLSLLAACKSEPAPGGAGGGATGGEPSTGDGDGDGGTGGDTDTDDTGGGDGWRTLPNDCTAPAPDGADPFTLSGQVNNTQNGPGAWFVEHLDVAWLPDEQRVLATGQGGLVVYDVVPGQDPVTRGYAGAGDMPQFQRYYQVLPAEPGLVWVTHRAVGLDTFDVSDADTPTQLAHVDGRGYEGLGRNGDWLYVASTEGRVDVFDISNPRAPERKGEVTGLGRPWDVHAVDGVAYVADIDLGVVALDLSVPDAPVVAATVESAGAPIRLDADGDGHLYVASGAGGLEILDLSSPLAPVRVAQVDAGGGALDVALDDGIVGVTTQEAVVLFDVGRDGTPAAPRPFAYQETEQFAMTLDADDGVWVVGDWNILGTWDLAPGPAPAIDVSQRLIAFLDEAETREIEVRNRGAATLDLAGIELPDGLSAQVSATSLAPGESATLAVSWDGTTLLDRAEICIASDDPGRPTFDLVVTGGQDGEGRVIGQSAPDFALEDLDGTVHRLSEQRGKPVVLAYFTTW